MEGMCTAIATSLLTESEKTQSDREQHCSHQGRQHIRCGFAGVDRNLDSPKKEQELQPNK